jgi:hypothetical protein
MNPRLRVLLDMIQTAVKRHASTRERTARISKLARLWITK